jgi:hypothetical protein
METGQFLQQQLGLQPNHCTLSLFPDFPVPLLAHNFQKERNQGPEGVDGEEGTAKEVAEDAKPGD